MANPSAGRASLLSCELDAFVTVRIALSEGFADARAAFELSFADASEHNGFLLFTGVDPLIDLLEGLRIDTAELDWLAAANILDSATRKRLTDFRFSCNVDAAPEGSVVFAGEPVLTVEGPFWQAQLIADFVRRTIGPSTLTATSFNRYARAAQERDVVMESVGAHDDSLLARAAYIGGATATTLAEAGRLYAIPVRAVQPNRVVNASPNPESTLDAWLGAAGHSTSPVFLDGALDEWKIAQIERNGPSSLVFLTHPPRTASTEGAIHYDLVAIEQDGAWTPKMRLGRGKVRSSVPGRKKVMRYFDADHTPLVDVAHAAGERRMLPRDAVFLDRSTGGVVRPSGVASSLPLLTNVMREGKRVTESTPSLIARDRARAAISSLPESCQRLTYPARYPVGISETLSRVQAIDPT